MKRSKGEERRREEMKGDRRRRKQFEEYTWGSWEKRGGAERRGFEKYGL